MKLTLYNTKGIVQKTTLNLEESVLGEKVNTALLAQALRIYETNSHQGTSKVKTRGEVNGSGRKIYKQKGTGRARHGAKYAPIFVGGGIAHGPKGIRTDNLLFPKKMRRAALRTALLGMAQAESIVGLSQVKDCDGKTSSILKLLNIATSHPKNKVLVVTKNKSDKLYQSLANLQNVTLKRASLVSAFDVVATDRLLITPLALDSILDRIKGGSHAK